MATPKSVTIVEVGPRDGLQNESNWVPTELKLEFIERLSSTGLKRIEATAFVSPDKIPQTRDAADVMKRLPQRDDIQYPVLVPNIKGYEQALAAGVREIAIFISATNSFSLKNIHCTIEESFDRYEAVAQAALRDGLRMRGYISCCLGCPYEGVVKPKVVADLAHRLEQLGCYEISLGDTIGVGTPIAAQALFKQVSQHVPMTQLAAHFHDTYGQAIANLYAVLQMGVSVIDSAVAGLGGCPYAIGATGNVATEDVLYLLNGLGIEHGVDLQLMVDTGDWICQILQRNNESKTARAILGGRRSA